ncbi:MAG: hypothetical protein V2B15_19505 [Bacteroidota bacterium]
MKKTDLLLLFLLVCANSVAFSQTKQAAEKLRRADCYFGVHFDLHATEDITDAGRTLTPEMIDTFLALVRPDFIQIDCKGHPGISSYPTRVGYPVKGFQKDPLKLWREVTEKNNVGLYMHFSGVWDNKVVKEHPDWAVVHSNGEKSRQKTSFFSPYLDTYFIPQLKELSDYGVDGAWVDGECWAVETDYGEASLEQFTRETGITDIPEKPTDKYYPEFIAYTRGLFREHMTKYVDAIHAYNPGFQITSNWAYSSMMPEKVTVGLDFLSGDVTPQNGVYRSAFEARCLAPQGKAWDLMAWGFSWNGGEMPLSVKTPVQLQQEAAQIIAMGGGVQFYYQQNRDLSIKPWLGQIIAELASFCRDRQPFCHKAAAIPQIALLYPTVSYLKNASKPFANPTEPLEGALNLILDGQYAVEILMEHHLSGKMDRYPVIVIPECDDLEARFMDELNDYVKGGGHLLIIGVKTTRLFEKELGIKSISPATEGVTFIESSGRIGSLRSDLVSVELMTGAKTLSTFYEGSDFRFRGDQIASSVNSLGKGSVTGIYFDAGSAYLKYKTPVLCDFIGDHLNDIFQDQLVEVAGSDLVHVAVNTLNNHMYVNLINVAGEHTNQHAIAFDEIPSLKDLTVRIKTSQKPSRIVLQPDHTELKFDFQDGISTVAIPELSIHSILEIVP